jgi:hypothetical protein
METIKEPSRIERAELAVLSMLGSELGMSAHWLRMNE